MKKYRAHFRDSMDARYDFKFVLKAIDLEAAALRCAVMTRQDYMKGHRFTCYKIVPWKEDKEK